MRVTSEEIDRRFQWYDATEDQVERMRQARNAFAVLGQTVNDLVADSREKSLTLTHLEEALMWTSLGIVREETGA